MQPTFTTPGVSRGFKRLLSSARRSVCSSEATSSMGSLHRRSTEQGVLDLHSRERDPVHGSDFRLTSRRVCNDKTSLVFNAVTRSGLGQQTTGSLIGSVGNFGSFGEEATLGFGCARVGNFLALNTERTGRFLDTPEFQPIHDRGNTGTIFDRPSIFSLAERHLYHLEFTRRAKLDANSQYLRSAESWTSGKRWCPSISRRAISTLWMAKTLFSANAFFRRDVVNYYASRDPLADSPATLGSKGGPSPTSGYHSDIAARRKARHNLKAST